MLIPGLKYELIYVVVGVLTSSMESTLSCCDVTVADGVTVTLIDSRVLVISSCITLLLETTV